MARKKKKRASLKQLLTGTKHKTRASSFPAIAVGPVRAKARRAGVG